MENTELPDLHKIYEELSRDAIKISEAVLNQTKSLYSVEKVYSYMVKTIWLAVLIFSVVALFLITTRPEPGAVIGLTLIWVFLVGLGIFGYRHRNFFLILMEVFQNVWNFYYRITLENVTVTGADPTERVLNKLKIAFPELDEYIKEKPHCIKMKAEVSGKSGKHEFDVYVHVDRSLLNKLTFGQFGEPRYDLILKRFSKEEPITEKDLSQLRLEMLDVYPVSRFPKKPIDRIIVVSTSSFSDDAIAYAMKGDNWIPPVTLKKGEEPTLDNYLTKAADLQIEFCTFDLIEESINRHKVVWAL